MKTHRIFVASSAKLAKERKAIELEIGRLNKIYAEDDIFLDPILWETLDSGVDAKRKQNSYNEEIKTCDILIMIYWGELGIFTNEEYQLALHHFRVSGKPKIYVFKKSTAIPKNHILNSENVKNLEIFETELKRLDKQHFAFEYKTIEQMLKKLSDDLRNLIDNEYFSEDRSNKHYIQRKDELRAAKKKLAAHKIICVNGKSGSGKTQFVENLLYGQTDDENVVWVDCAESTPTPIEIAEKILKVINIKAVNEFRKKLEKESLREEELKSNIERELPSLTDEAIREWFPEGNNFRKKYLILDDFDNLITGDEGNLADDPENDANLKGHWLAGNFLEKCLEYEWAPRIILIFKHDKTKWYLNKRSSRTALNDLINFVETNIEISPFKSTEIKDYLTSYDISISNNRLLQEIFVIKDKWLPIQLQLLTAEMGKISSDQLSTEPFLKNLKSFLERPDKTVVIDKDLIEFLSLYIFRRIRKEGGDLLNDIVVASAVLQRYNVSHDAIDKDALIELVNWTKGKDALNLQLEHLKSLSVFKNFDAKKFDDNTDNDVQYDFQHDTKLDFAYEGMIKNDLFKNEVLLGFHQTAAEYYEEKFNGESPEIKYGEFAVFHYSSMADEWWNKMLALDILDKIDRDMRTDFRYIDLAELRRSLTVPVESTRLKIQDGDEESRLYLREQASNLANLAEIYFQGLDKWPDAKEMAIDVTRHFGGRNSSDPAFLQAAHLAAILNFETELSAEKTLEIFNTNGDFDGVEKQLICAKLAELLLLQNLNLDLNKVYTGSYKIEEIDGMKNRALIANILSSLGVFLNRAEAYGKAIKAYELAIKMLNSIKEQLKDCNEQNSWDDFIERDLMCIHSNLSRSILLSVGVDKAIEYFETNLEPWFGTNTKEKTIHPYSSSQEYNYALMNISYYHFCKGNLEKAYEWWDKSQDVPGEDWLKLTKEQMWIVLIAYDKKNKTSNKSLVLKDFEENIKKFEEIDGRAALFSRFNKTCLEVAVILQNIREQSISIRKSKEKAIEEEKQKERIYHRHKRNIEVLLKTFEECRAIADSKQYASAAKVMTYTQNEFIRQLQEVYGLKVNASVMMPHPAWNADWKEEVFIYLGDIMNKNNSAQIAFDPWRPPMLMAGILLMRSKPFSPTDEEIENILQQKSF